jgi:hypothetical protein
MQRPVYPFSAVNISRAERVTALVKELLGLEALADQLDLLTWVLSRC